MLGGLSKQVSTSTIGHAAGPSIYSGYIRKLSGLTESVEHPSNLDILMQLVPVGVVYGFSVRIPSMELKVQEVTVPKCERIHEGTRTVSIGSTCAVAIWEFPKIRRPMRDPK